MRAVYLIIWVIITAIICFLLYERDGKAKLLPQQNDVVQTNGIVNVDTSLAKPSVDETLDRNQDSLGDESIYPADSSMNTLESNQAVEKEQDQSKASQGNISESSEREEFSEEFEREEFLLKAYIEFGQNSMKLPQMENLEKFLDSISLVVIPSDLLIVLEGHADKSKSRRFDNYEVAQKRADFLKNALTSRGVPENRIQTISRGDTLPRMQGNSAEARKSNRRVELFIKQNNR